MTAIEEQLAQLSGDELLATLNTVLAARRHVSPSPHQSTPTERKDR